MSLCRSRSKPRLKRLSAVLAALAAFGCAPRAEEPKLGPAEHRAEIETWRQQRDESLRKLDGWLTLAGLFWLDEGNSTFGSAEDNDLVFRASGVGEKAGVLRREGRDVSLLPGHGTDFEIDGQPVGGVTRLALDTSGDPTVVTRGSVSFHPIERGEMIGIRLKDGESEVLKSFEGMSYFPIEIAWRRVGRYEKFDMPRVLRTPNVLGTVTEEEIYGEVTFEWGGETHRLQPSGDPAEGFFLVFGDLTNGVETYGGGRFLYTDPVADDGTVVVDFNRAYCPPCVFTPYATCPLPPPENRLAWRVEAGEKMFGQAH